MSQKTDILSKNKNNQQKFHQSPTNNKQMATSIYDFYNLANIGSGAFAHVYKGYELLPSTSPPKYRQVALKRINVC